jgi:APA family basic amino acid/polyamine antiporter
MSNQWFARKPVEMLLKEVEGSEGANGTTGKVQLHRVLSSLSLTSLGVGAIIGTGIFVLTGVAAHDKTGPALILSFVVAGIACIFAALCYSEFAAMVPALGKRHQTGALFDLPAIFIVALITLVLVKGVKESVKFNTVMVVIKLVIVAFVIIVGAFYVHPANWHPFAPYGYFGISFFGKTLLGQTGKGGEPLGMLAGAGIIFFAYIGFDSISTHAEEAKNPQRDVPIAILVSLVVSTVLYILVAAVLTGMVPYNRINVDAPISEAFKQVGLPWAQLLISLGAIAGITSVLLVTMLSQPRILLAMGRDGLLPKGFFSAVHPRFQTPWKSTILTGVFVGALAAFLSLRVLADLVNIGTLLAFVIVCAAVLIMRRTHPETPRPFRAPLVPLVPLLGIATCLLLMFSLPVENWVRLFVWLVIGMTIYFGYGRHHSIMAQ